MSNEEFLRRLESALKERLPEAELKNVMDYHREYFSEAGENAADELDPPEIIAQRVLEEFRGEDAPPKMGGIPTWVKICLIAVVAVSAAVTVSKGVQKAVHWVFSESPRAADAVTEAIVTPNSVSEAEVTAFDGRVTVSHSLTSFSCIQVEGAAADVVIQSGGDYSFSIEYGPKEHWDYALDGETLTLTGDGVSNPFSTVEGAAISVTCPANTQLDRVDVDLDVGNIILDGVKGEVCFLDTDVGDVNVTGSSFVELTCGTDTGDIWVEGEEFHILDCESNVGDVAVSGVSASSQVTLSADMGSVTAVLPGSPRDWSLDLEADMGDVWVDGRAVSDDYETHTGRYSLECSTDVGDITVDFVGDDAVETTT